MSSACGINLYGGLKGDTIKINQYRGLRRDNSKNTYHFDV